MTQTADPNPSQTPATGAARRPWVRRYIPAALVLIAAAAVYAAGWHRALSLEMLVAHHAAINAFIAANGWLATLAYIAMVCIALPGGLLVTSLGGFLFGITVGGVGGIVGATIGATAMFAVAKSAFGGRLFNGTSPTVARLIKGFRDDAFNYVVFLRMTPVPFQFVNLVPALLDIRLRTFFLATALGVIPTRMVFAAFGASIDTVLAPQIAAFNACRAAEGADCGIEINLDAAFNPQIIGAMAALCVVALIPVGLKRWRTRAQTVGANG